MKKRKYGRILSMILTVCMLLGVLPADLLGGIASVKAAPETDSYGIVRDIDGDTTTWTFTGAATAVDNFANPTTSGITTSGTQSSSVGLKVGYLRIYGPRSGEEATTNIGKLALPLDSATTSVELTITLSGTGDADSQYGERYIKVGNETNSISVYHGKTPEAQATYPENFGVNGGTWTKTLDSSYFTDNTLVITGGVGENKIASIKIVETKGSTGGNLVDRNATYKFTWNDSDSDNVIPSTSDGKGPHTSSDGKVQVYCGPSNQFKNHNSQYGTQFCTGNTISVNVNGDATIVLAGSQHSQNASITVTDSNDNEVVTVTDTKTTSDFEYGSDYNVLSKDENSTIIINYTGEATTLTLTFGSTGDGSKTYCPWMTVYWQEEAPATVEKEFTLQIPTPSFRFDGAVHILNAETDDQVASLSAGFSGSVPLYTKTKYNVKSTDLKAKATVGGKTSFTTGEDAGTITVDLESLVVNPTVVLKAGSALAADKTLSIVDKNDVSTPVSVDSSVELWIGETYTITEDDDTVEARVNGSTSFTATADMTTLEIELVPQANRVTMAVNGISLGSAKVVMTNTADANDKQEFGNGDMIELKLNATYEISCTDSEIFAKIDGKTTYKVTEAISALTVELTRAEYHTYDVWDFGATDLPNTIYDTYNNNLTKDVINSWFTGVAPGTSGQQLPLSLDDDPVTAKDSSGEDALRIVTGNVKKWRLRLMASDVPGLTYDSTDGPFTDVAGNTLSDVKGIMYDNQGKHANGSGFQLYAKAGDIFTVLGSSNGGPADYTWEAPGSTAENPVKDVVQYTGASRKKMQTMTFYAAEDGWYSLYTPNEKMVVARIYRERPASVAVSGSVTAPADADLSNAQLVFTQMKDDKVINTIKTPITNGSYSASLQEQYTYELSLEGVSGYIIDTVVTGTLELANGDGKTGRTFPVTIASVDLVTVTGSLAALTNEDAAKLKLTFTNTDATKSYMPAFIVTEGTNTFTAVLEKGENYLLEAENVDDYDLTTTSISASADGTQNIVFTKKPVYDIAVTLNGPAAEEAANVKLTFSYLKDVATGEIDSRYIYEFTGTSGVQLRDGQYKVTAELEGYEQATTPDLKVTGAAGAMTITMKSTAPAPEVPYKETIAVAQDGSGDYLTINEALDAVRNMKRNSSQRVTISIKPGDYEEMLVIDVDNVTLKNASDAPSIGLKDNGVHIDDNAVRITSYYGHGYSYYSMGEDWKWDADVLAANKANGYESVTNLGSGSKTFWNATVEIQANGFQADGIIFENSFNQYVSKKAAEDVIVKWATGAKEGSEPRATLPEGSTAVQQKAYVERAAALAIGNGMSDIVFNNCKFIGRQDTLYGGTNTYAEFNECSIYGGTDYIFGGMTAIFDKCDLVFNTTDDKNDVGYITAAQQASGRGYLMNECHITSVKAGVDVDGAYYTHNTSKPGYLGRPWAANTSEVVFYNTTIDAADSYWHNATAEQSKTSGASLIAADGWDSSLSGESAGMCEYGTVEIAGMDNSANRATWATVLTGNKLADGTYITKDAFRKNSAEGLYEMNLTKGLKAGVNYDGGISVLADMPYNSTNGYVQGSVNPSGDNKGGIPDGGAVLKLVAQADGRLKVNMKGAGGKTVYWVDAENSENSKNWVSNVNETVIFTLEAGHTYYFYGNGTKLCMYSIAVDYRPYVAWDTVSNPILGTPVAAKIGDADEGTVKIPFTAAIGSIYSESMDVKVFREGELVDTVSVKDETDPLKGFEGNFTYEPQASGNYTFQAILKRSDEANKLSTISSAVAFVLPMAQPVIVNTENTGSGNVRFIWQETPEATSYEVYLNDTKVGTTTKLFYRFEGLEVGTKYDFGVVAIGNNDASEKAVSALTVTADAQKNWLFSAFGQGVDTKNNKVNDKIEGKDDTTLALQSTGGKGKLVPASTDGLAFYYTTIDPETENFTLSAKVKIDEWTYSNGQEGFGMMVADAVGKDGDSSVFWNNSYMASVTKVEYYWDSASQTASDSGTKYTMKLGVGSQEKIGVTKENLSEIAAGNLNDFRSAMTTLETSCPKLGLPAGTYNLAANYTNEGVDMGDVEGITDTFDLTIQRNNTGYFISYTDKNGVTTTKKYYHGDDGDELTKLDPNNIYVGFFASRNAKISVTDVKLTTIKPEDDAPAEERPFTYVTPNYSIESATVSNSKDYEIVFVGNADGTLKLAHAGKVLVDGVKITANEKYKVSTTLNDGYNEFVATFTPNADYYPSQYERLSSYETKEIKAGTTYQEFNRNIIYVSPNGSANADGSKDNPMSIYKAVCYVQPGNVILLKEGTYSLKSTLTIERGIDGTAADNIYMIADPEAKTRPVLDFNRACAGMVMAGNYWYFQGFDVTNSANGQKGIQVSGSYNTLDNLYTYKNGNTGIQISRFKGTDLWEDWPSYNLILNCTSFLNADAGYEDADGFAAKLTIADGNVFDGCIAAYNADDGWDLFAKIESGPIGQVKIQNSVAFKNGYVVDENGNEVNAGNGNGFKMGGSSISGHHVLYNSVAFANKSKGIDSNSCPDIMVYSSTSFDNESYNVAFYTNDAKNTDFTANGVLSYKKSNTEGENIKLKGTQEESKVYGVTNYYFNSGKSKNSTGDTVSDQWFVNLDTATAIKNGISRNTDRTISMNGYLELASLVPEGVGARMVGMASKNIELPELVVKDDSGNADKPGDANDSGNTDKPGDANDSGNTDKPGDADDSGNADKPDDADDSGNTDKPGDTDDNGNTDKPGSADDFGNTDKPGNADDSGNADKPGNADESDDTDDSGNADNADATTTTKNPAQNTETEKKPSTNKKPSKTPETTPEKSQSETIVKKVVINQDMDWNEVNQTLRELITGAAGGNAVLEIELGKYYELSTDVLIALMGTDVTMQLQQSNGIIWEINGKDITNPSKVNMKVELNSNAIPADKMEIFKEFGSAIQFSLEHNGDFGFKANMKFPVSKNAEGKFANLFYYNNGEFEFMSSSKVSEGYAEFAFTHASDYVVVISEAAMSAVPEVKTDTKVETETSGKSETENTNVTANAGAENNAETATTSGSSLPIILIILAVLAVGGIAIAVVVMRKKKEN